MRKLTLLLLVIISLLEVQISFSQITNWSQLKRLTTGFKDSNPSFGPITPYLFYQYPWEFLVFQREVDTASQICVMRIYKSGILDTVRYLTAGNSKKRNPAVSYRKFATADTVKNAMAVWESNQNGKWDIYGSYYTLNSGWSSPFPIDSGAGNKYNTKVIMYTANEFGIIYTKNDDITYLRFNGATQTILNETNLSSSISFPCSSSLIAQPYPDLLSVNFRFQKPDNSFGIYRISSTNNGTTWTGLDTAAYTGNNTNIQITTGSNGSMHIFESVRNGKSGIYSHTPGSLSGLQETVFASPYFNYYGLKNWYYPIITDIFPSHVSTFIRKSNDSTKILFGSYSSIKDSLTLGDSSKKVSITLNNGIRTDGNNYLFCSVFNKDTAGFTSLYYKSIVIISSGIHYTGNEAVNNFNLYQNYPNPFNPTTKIKFDIPKLSNIKIIIFDAVGREVKNITQNNLTAGSYEYEFNGENLSSGIYYFKLQTNEFSKSVKMVLVK